MISDSHGNWNGAGPLVFRRSATDRTVANARSAAADRHRAEARRLAETSASATTAFARFVPAVTATAFARADGLCAQLVCRYQGLPPLRVPQMFTLMPMASAMAALASRALSASFAERA